MKRKYILLLGVVTAVFLLLLSFSLFQKSVNKRENDKTSFDRSIYIAFVAGEGIKRSDYEKELVRTKHFFTWAKQDINKLPSLEKDVLERMVEMKIVSLYARKNDIAVSQKEIEDYYHALLGKKSETEQLATIKEMYGMEKTDYWQKLSDDLVREKVQKHLQKPLAPWLMEMKKTVAL